MAWHGWAWRGEAWQGLARRGKARFSLKLLQGGKKMEEPVLVKDTKNREIIKKIILECAGFEEDSQGRLNKVGGANFTDFQIGCLFIILKRNLTPNDSKNLGTRDFQKLKKSFWDKFDI